MNNRSRHSHRSRGYTLFEVVIVLVIGSLLVGVGVGLARSALGLSAEDRQRTQLQADHRRNLEHLTNVLRNADLGSVLGFDPKTGVATGLQFQRPTGAVDGVRILGVGEQLLWQPSSTPVSGILNPGDVYLVGPTTTTVAAARVPADGFRITQSGRCLVLHLTTYRPDEGPEALRVSSTTRVRLRN